MTEKPTSSKSKTSIWRRLLWGVGIVALIAAGGYYGVTWYANSVARKQVAEQFQAAAGGSVEMGDVSVGLNGVTAESIEITGDQGTEPWAKIGKLKIEAPLSQLMGSDAKYDRLEASDAELTLDLDAEGNLLLDLPESEGEFSLPAKRIDVVNASVTIRQPDRSDFVAKGVELAIVETESGIEIKGDIQSLADAQWKVDATFNPDSNFSTLNASTDRLDLDSAIIAKWPLTPPGVLDEIGVNGPVKTAIELRTGGDEETHYAVNLQPLGADVRIKSLDLDMNLASGSMDFSNGKLHFEKLNAKLAEGSALLKGDIDFTAYPFTGEYQADVSNVSVETIAKLAPIPPELSGNVNGNASGSVVVNEDLSFSLALQARGASENGEYLGFALRDPKIDVAIESLKFDDKVAVTEIKGDVKVNTHVADVAVNEFFDRFELKAAGDAPQLAGNANADVKLNIPLATADQVGTWDMTVDAKAPRLSVAKEQVKDVEARIEIAQGDLKIRRVTGNVVENDLGELGAVSFQGEMPLDEKPLAKFEVQGNSVAVDWLVGVAKDYSPDVDSVLRIIDKQYDGEKSSVGGKLTVNAKLAFPPAAVNDFGQWRIEGDVTEGNLIVDDREIKNLKSKFLLENSVLDIENLQGELDQGGDISVKGTIPLEASKPAALDMSAAELPLLWLAAIGVETSPEFADALKQADIDLTKKPADLAGNLSFSVKLARAAAKIVDEKPVAAPWLINAVLQSNKLSIKGNELTDLKGDFALTEDEVVIKEFRTNTPGNGSIRTTGSWPLEEKGAGELNVQWNRLSIELLAQLTGAADLNARGTTTGKINVQHTFKAGEPSTWSAAGTIGGDEVSIYDIPLGNVAANVETVGDEIKLSDVVIGDSEELKLAAKLQTQTPYAFEVKSNIEKLSLAKVFHGQAAFADLPKITGLATLKADLAGTLEPLKFVTSGNADIDKLVVAEQSLDQVTAQWKNLGSTKADGEAIIHIVGGRVELDEWSNKPEKIAVKINDLSAEQLTTLADLPVPFTGLISGEAVFESWSDPKTKHANLVLRGAAAKLGLLEVGQINAELDLLNQQLSYQAGGTVLDGVLSAQGETVLAESGVENTTFPIAVKLTETNLNRIHTLSSHLNRFRELQGVVSLNFDLAATGPDFLPEGTGRVAVRNVRYKSRVITTDASTGLRLAGGEISSDRFRASVGGGEVSGTFRYPLMGNQNGSYELNVRRVQVAVFSMFDPTLERESTGWFDARLIGAIGRTLAGSGQIAATRVGAYGLDGDSVRLPVNYRVNLADFSGHLEIRRTQLRLLHGTISAKGDLHWGRRIDLNLDATLTNVDSGQLVSALAGSDVYDQGKLSGKLELTGRNVRTLRDLRGKFHGSLDRSRSLQLPVLSDLAIFVNAGQLSQREFDSRDMDFTLSNGTVTVNSLTFSNEAAKIFITGSATLEQRLDLDVVAYIGNLNSNQAFQAIVQSPLSRLTAVGWFARVTNFLSDRTVYLHVGGTASNPVFRLKSGLILRDEVVRFLLQDVSIQNYSQIPLN